MKYVLSYEITRYPHAITRFTEKMMVLFAAENEEQAEKYAQEEWRLAVARLKRTTMPRNAKLYRAEEILFIPKAELKKSLWEKLKMVSSG